MAAKKEHPEIKLGTAVLYFNQWTGYRNRDVTRHFRKASAADIERLRAGDVIWINEDPIHPNGKVYGFVKARVKKVEGKEIHFDSGFTTFHNKIFLVSDESVLSELIASDPKMTDVIGGSGRMASRLLGLG